MKKKKLIYHRSCSACFDYCCCNNNQSISKWSKLSFEAIVQEVVTQPDGETRLIVERTTEVYGNPLNSLSIS